MRLSSHLAVPVRPFWVFFGPSSTPYTYTLPATTAAAAMVGNIDVTTFLPTPGPSTTPSDVEPLTVFSSQKHFLATGGTDGHHMLKENQSLCAAVLVHSSVTPSVGVL